MTSRPHRRPPLSRLPSTAARRTALLATAVAAGLAVLLAASPAPAAAPPTADVAATASWPLAPRPEVVSHFDPPASTWGAGHRGVDLLGTPGQPVRAAVGGTVAYAGLLAGKGVVVVRHGTTRTTYEPVDAAVEVGATVTAGDVLGHLHPGGSHCLPRICLHWGLIEDTAAGDAYRDPLTLVGGGPVRLLPWAGLPTTTPSWVPVPADATLPRPRESRIQARGWAWR